MSVPNSHCWVCDDHGGLHVLKNINTHCGGSCRWTSICGGFKSIYAGYGGLVCGIKDSSLHIRKNVSYHNPVGKGWTKDSCDILKAMPGRTCIVRMSARGMLYWAKFRRRDDEILDWTIIPPQHEDEGNDRIREDLQYVVDDKDRLFGVTGSGDVSYCELLIDGDLHWVTIAMPPHPRASHGIVNWLSSFLRTNSSDANRLTMVSAGMGSLWCVMKDSNEIWQLVIGQLNGAPKANWVKADLELSDDEEIVSLSGCKSAVDGLYVIVKGEGYFKMVAFSLNPGGRGRVEMELPVRYPCRSLGVCSAAPAGTIFPTATTPPTGTTGTLLPTETTPPAGTTFPTETATGSVKNKVCVCVCMDN